MKLSKNTSLQGGRYSIIESIGKGGFGITYLATQRGLDRTVVIKEFFMSDYCARERDTLRVTFGTDSSRGMIERFREKFVKEARNIAAFDHPNIVRVIDVFEENNTAYYVMEYHSAGSLGSLVDNRGALNEDDALYYIRQVASALKYVHSRKMMHLDIKPDNILVNSSGEAVLIDFGLSKRYDEKGKATSTTPIGISHGYAPMEQYNPGGVGEFSPAIDVYSLGATLFTLLTGEMPPPALQLVDSRSLQGVLVEKNVSGAVAEAVIKSMSFMKEARPQSVDEFLALLDAQPATGSSSRPTQPMAKSGGGVSRPTAPMNNNGAATADNEPKKPFNWKIPVGIVAAILCVVFAGVGINNYNNKRAEQERRAIIERARLDSIAAVRKAAEDKRISDSIANELRNAFVTKNFTVDNVSFTMVAVAGGTFNMGSNDGEGDEKPVHSVTLSDYYIGETEVTQALWQAVMGSNPSMFKGGNNPVEQVSYNDCIDFINKLNTLLAGQLPAGRKFRLPTEAQWEFAARGGNKGKNNNNKYSGSNSIDDVAWYRDNSGYRTHPVKQKQANELGLYDMSGNVVEWCYDWYGSDYYSSSPQTNPQGPSSGSRRVLRGACWDGYAQWCRVTNRSSGPDYRGCTYGLRLAF